MHHLICSLGLTVAMKNCTAGTRSAGAFAKTRSFRTKDRAGKPVVMAARAAMPGLPSPSDPLARIAVALK